MNGERDRHTDTDRHTDRERAMGVGGGTTLVTAGKHFSCKVTVSSSGCHTVLGQATMAAIQGLAARVRRKALEGQLYTLQAHSRATPLSSQEGAEGKRSGDGVACCSRVVLSVPYRPP